MVESPKKLDKASFKDSDKESSKYWSQLTLEVEVWILKELVQQSAMMPPKTLANSFTELEDLDVLVWEERLSLFWQMTMKRSFTMLKLS